MPEHEDKAETGTYKGGSAGDVGKFTYRASVSLTKSGSSWYLTVSMMAKQPDFDGKWSITGSSSLMVDGIQVSAQAATLPTGAYFSDGDWYYVGSSTYNLSKITSGNVTLRVGGGWAISQGAGWYVPTIFSSSGFQHTIQISNQNGGAGVWH